MANENGPVVGIVLAGGRAQRMGGGDKPLRMLAGRNLLDHVLERFAPQCATLAVNANGDPARFDSYRLPIVADTVAGFPGPLAGILAGLEYTVANFPDTRWVASVPGDCPFLPRDLVARLQEGRARQGADIAIARSAGRMHPVVGLWPVSVRNDLRRALLAEGVRKVELFLTRYRIAQVEWSTRQPDPFFNVNTAEELGEAERLLPLLRD